MKTKVIRYGLLFLLLVLEYYSRGTSPAMAMHSSVDEAMQELRQAGFQSFDVEVNLLPYPYIIKAR